MQSLSHLKHSPLEWVPSLYFAMGLPFVVLNMVSAVDEAKIKNLLVK